MVQHFSVEHGYEATSVPQSPPQETPAQNDAEEASTMVVAQSTQASRKAQAKQLMDSAESMSEKQAIFLIVSQEIRFHPFSQLGVCMLQCRLPQSHKRQYWYASDSRGVPGSICIDGDTGRQFTYKNYLDRLAYRQTHTLRDDYTGGLAYRYTDRQAYRPEDPSTKDNEKSVSIMDKKFLSISNINFADLVPKLSRKVW